ncbi:MAG: flagellar export chaperone FliS [Syntrophaceae bacterium]
MNVSGIQAYKKVQFETADQGTLILMCYDGAITFLRKGKHAMINHENATCSTYLGKAQNVLWELTNSLNLNAGEIAYNLEALYNYMIRRIIDAEYHKKPEAIDEVVKYLLELKESWEKIIHK